MENIVKSNSGETTVASGTIFSTETFEGKLPEAILPDPFFAVPSLFVDEPQVQRTIDTGVTISITF